MPRVSVLADWTCVRDEARSFELHCTSRRFDERMRAWSACRERGRERRVDLRGAWCPPCAVARGHANAPRRLRFAGVKLLCVVNCSGWVL